MPTQITAAALETLNATVSLAFNDQLYATTSLVGRWCQETTSDAAENIYPRLDMLQGLREWIGERVVNQLSEVTFTIKNKTFEGTIGVKREDVEDDKYGVIVPIAAQLGQNAAQLPDLLATSLLKAGATTPCYDGQNFFDTDHPTFDASGAPTTAANYTSGATATWYLLDTKRVLKPMIVQKRRPFRTVARFSLTDPAVFDNNQFVWGVDGRLNVGFGIWQLIYASKAALTPANIVAARTAMASYRRPDGTPMGIMPDTLMVPSTLYPIAKSIYSQTFDPTQAAGSLLPNEALNLVEPLENPWLN
jgi:phage major head subunit gpT-like protein